MVDKLISELLLGTPAANDPLVFQKIADGLFYKVLANAANGIPILDASGKVTQRLSYEAVANGVATLDGSVLVPVAQLPTATAGAESPNKLPILDSAGALGIVRTLAGGNKTVLALNTTDGKSYQFITRSADGAVAFYNSTDVNTVLLLGPGVTDIKDGNGRLLVDYGSNANGYYARFSSGVQIAWVRLGSTTPATAYGGSGFYYSVVSWTFPASFIATPWVVTDTQRTGGAMTWMAGPQQVTTTAANSAICYSANTSTALVPVFVAIGRWF